MSPLDGLFPASFKGVPFHVESDKDGQGLEGDIKTFPQRRGARVRDFGLGKREIAVEAYISAFDNSANAAEAFRSAMLSPGLGYLSLPNAIVPRALCTRCERSFKRSEVGKISFALNFVADDEETTGASLSSLSSAISMASAALLSKLPGMISPPGASAWFASGVQRGLVEMAAVTAKALPNFTSVATFENLTSIASGIPVGSVPGEAAAAEVIAKTN